MAEKLDGRDIEFPLCSHFADDGCLLSSCEHMLLYPKVIVGDMRIYPYCSHTSTLMNSIYHLSFLILNNINNSSYIRIPGWIRLDRY